MDCQMMSCPWDPIGQFRSRGEFERFLTWMADQLDHGVAEEITVEKPYLTSPAFTEKWFRHRTSGEVWRLVWPDGPFTGTFEMVQ